MPSDYIRRGLIDHGSDACLRHLLQHTAAIVNAVREFGTAPYTGQRRRLRHLTQRGYLERLTLPLEREAPIGSPPDAFVYQLAARGVLKAKECGFVDEDYRYTREKSNLFLAHDLVITKIHLMLELAIRSTALELVAWEQRRSVLLDWAENGSGRLSVNPDALFGLKDLAKPEGQNTTYFSLRSSGPAKATTNGSSLTSCARWRPSSLITDK
jgi:hypothetical protein